MCPLSQIPPLTEAGLDPNPILQFNRWFHDAEQAEGTLYNAMTLATVNSAGAPSARIVLLRGVEENGFVFYTNYASRKAGDLQDNPHAALVFHWQVYSRQVRVEGEVHALPAEVSDCYFANRPRGHQIGAHVSPQSSVIPSREWLEKRFASLESTLQGQEVPRPESWGGYLLVPRTVEFWQEGANRLHDRFRYFRQADSEDWLIERLAP